MTGRIPVIPTIIVLAAAATMAVLGIWQLQRAEWKSDLKARYGQALAMSSEVRWPADPASYGQALYRRATITCDRVIDRGGVAGRSENGMQGWMQTATCARDGGGEAEVALGWSSRPQAPLWSGGEVSGLIAPAGEGIRLIANPAQAGLGELAPPDPNDLPDNHLAYAFQWFFFALTALGIYWLALRKKWRENG